MTEPEELASRLSRQQRSLIAAADPATGRLPANAPDAAVAGLIRHRCAQRAGRLGAVYLTATGRAVGAGLGVAPRQRSAPAQDRSGPFAPATGDEVAEPLAPPAAGTAHPGADATGITGPKDPGAERAEVEQAWRALLEQRRILGTPGPAPWETRSPDRMVRAVALALQAAGVPPSAIDSSRRRTRTGYRVHPGEAGTVRVEWTGPADSPARRYDEQRRQLDFCAGVLLSAGWQSLLYRSGQVSYLGVTAAAGSAG
ncbi:hypothetical protein POF50_029735 [Streptomyces sp. SL13]|uniref:Uncharacterized protein n=1 Tax=Streptantibioticus silvisoli TaxID=2705255 RepID=A0AA90H7S1_9ACTN|nr:hypothetical protein [Streptantibioticus silvisoli]MDI5973476.1 hypothetical protein [Streptantibioticus silvisoli]